MSEVAVQFNTCPEENVQTGEKYRREVLDIDVRGTKFTLPISYEESRDLLNELNRAIYQRVQKG